MCIVSSDKLQNWKKTTINTAVSRDSHRRERMQVGIPELENPHQPADDWNNLTIFLKIRKAS